MLDPTPMGETGAGHDAVTMDIKPGATRMKYLHDPLLAAAPNNTRAKNHGAAAEEASS